MEDLTVTNLYIMLSNHEGDHLYCRPRGVG